MYSPKISEDLIPVLYHTARAKRMPMTKLVDKLIRKALATESLPYEAIDVSPRIAPPSAQAAA